MIEQENQWTPERIAQLIKLHPTHTGTEIAKIMETTKGAVVGKAHRLGLPPKKHTPGPRINANRHVARKKQLQRPTFKPRPNNKPLVPLADLGNGCPWPYGDPQDDDFGFCGQEKDGKKAYCAEHNERAYLPKKKRSGRVTFALKPLTN